METKERVSPVAFRWHLRTVMAAQGMFATSDLVPLLASRGVVLSREQVYRLVARTPQRLSLMTLSALCDILGCSPAELVEPISGHEAAAASPNRPGRAGVGAIRPKRARIMPVEKR
jgi:DNA-binding Xre family transcriptional regulator